MKIEKIEIKPMGFSHEPEFHIILDYYRTSSKTPLRFNGYIFLNRYKLAFLHEYEINYGRSEALLATNSPLNQEVMDRRIFVAPLSRLALAKLHNARIEDPKGDLKLNLHIQFVYLESMFTGVRKKDGSEPFTLATLTEGALLRTTTEDLDHNVTISASEWTHDFAPKFEHTKYQVFEIPVPFALDGKSDFSNRLNAAIASLQEMEKVKMIGDWQGVVKESRPVWELIRNKQEIEDLLSNADFNNDTIVAYKKLIDTAFDFASKFVHREARNKTVMTINNVSKEDAELIFNLAASLVNLIARKILRSGL